MNTAQILRKTAGVLRNQEEEKLALAKRVDSLEKEAHINRAIINLVKENLLDSDEVESKIAEFQSNPQLLEETKNFFEKSADVGELNGDSLPSAEAPESNFLSGLQ